MEISVFQCTGCETRFSTSSTLEAHKKYYCSGRDINIKDSRKRKSRSPSPDQSWKKKLQRGPTDPRSPTRPVIPGPTLGILNPNPHPSAILLPVGTSDGGIQIIGQPQVIVPVVVPKSCDNFSVEPILLEESWMTGATVPSRSLSINVRESQTGSFGIPLVIRRTVTKTQSPSPRVKPTPPEESSGRTRENKKLNQVEPLDLSVPCKTDVERAESSTPTKSFHCQTCGIRFSALKTLQGHQEFYCKGRGRNSENGKGGTLNRDSPSLPHRSPELCCCLCSFVATNTGQMLQHTRIAHSIIQG